MIARTLSGTLPVLSIAIAIAFVSAQPAKTGKLSIKVAAKGTDQAIPCRIHLKDPAGKPVRAPNLPFWHDHFVCPGQVQLDLPPGNYAYEIERGPEYRQVAGTVAVSEGKSETINAELDRIADMKAEGWWSGELHVHRPVSDIELLMRAEDLHVAPVITWWNNRNEWTKQKPPEKLLVNFDGNRFYHVMGGEDEREGGALLYFNLQQPLAITGASREFPSPLTFVEQARKQPGVTIDAEKPFWWDLPTWLASGQVDSIGIANNHMCRSQMYENEAWGKPRLTDRLPAPRGNGFWSQEIYYHVLNCGLRIPPSAGSASGVLPNPVGYNRVYVHLGPTLDHGFWWDELRAGQSFVTNGPLLRVRASGQLPGNVFGALAGQQINIDLRAKLTSRDPIKFIEIVKDGKVESQIPFETWEKSGSLGSVNFKTSGWFLVRAITDNTKTFRFASTAPFYVEIGSTPRRVSKASAQFFLDWVRERIGRIKLTDPTQQAEVLKFHQTAEAYWKSVVEKANAE